MTVRREDLREKRTELHFSPDAAGFHIGQDAFQIAVIRPRADAAVSRIPLDP